MPRGVYKHEKRTDTIKKDLWLASMDFFKIGRAHV
jgi:hypothetical protein